MLRLWPLGRFEKMQKAPIPSWKVPAAAGYLLITVTFVFIGGYSAIAKLDSAVTAQGVVAAETNRKTVQHLEGGIVSEILVREGQHVNQDQVLFRLNLTQPQASRDLLQNQLDFQVAQEARLLAERDGEHEVPFPKELLDRKDDPNVAHAIADQVAQFRERSESLKGQTDIYESKIGQYRTEIDGVTAEREGTKSQLNYINQELVDVKYLFERNLVAKSRMLSLERERSRLEGAVGRSTADLAKAENGIGEARLQIRQIRQKFLEDVASAIQETRQKIADSREKLRVAQDVLTRVDILSPTSGIVQNMHVFTTGGVVKPGEPLLDVVPETDALIVQAHVLPQDTESLAAGMIAEIRFSSFHTRVMPLITGHVQSVSRDRLTDDQTKQPYFLAQVVADDLPDAIRERLSAGMPADVIFPTGERTVLDYLVRPLKERLRGVMREK
jgi:HlyD family secretion protein